MQLPQGLDKIKTREEILSSVAPEGGKRGSGFRLHPGVANVQGDIQDGREVCFRGRGWSTGKMLACGEKESRGQDSKHGVAVQRREVQQVWGERARRDVRVGSSVKLATPLKPT